MKWTRTIPAVLVLCGSVGFSLSIGGSTAAGKPDKRDYSVIVERNPFGLRPPPPPRTNSTATLPPQEEIFLTGITSLGQERAYFMNKPGPGKPSEYYSLSAGEAHEGLEVVDIDPASRSVKVREEGVEKVMTFQTNGVKPQPAVLPKTPRLASSTQPRVGGTLDRGLASSRLRAIPRHNLQTSSLPGAERNPGQGRVRPFPAAQDVLMMELQKASNPHITYPPTPMPSLR